MTIVYENQHSQEIKRDHKAEVIPRIGEKVSFKNTSSNLLDIEKNELFVVTDVIHNVEDAVIVKVQKAE